MKERIGRVKVRKEEAQGNDSLIGNAQNAHICKAKQGIHSPLVRQAGRWSAISRKPYCSKHLLLPSSFIRFYCSEWCHVVWNIPLGLFVPSVSSPSFSCAASLLAGRYCEKQNDLETEHCLAINKVWVCYQYCFGHQSKATYKLLWRKLTQSQPKQAGCYLIC